VSTYANAGEYCYKVADICFVVDSSGSINKADPGNWNRILQFMKHIVRSLSVDSSGTRVAIVLFSNEGRVHLQLNEMHDKQSILDRIDHLPYMDGNTNTSGGLYMMKHIVFKATNGDRPNVPNMAIVITDGHSTWDKRLTGPYAKEARDSGIRMLAVGISDEINMAELKSIASFPHSRTIFRVDDFDKLSSALNNLVGEACIRGMCSWIASLSLVYLKVYGENTLNIVTLTRANTLTRSPPPASLSVIFYHYVAFSLWCNVILSHSLWLS